MNIIDLWVKDGERIGFLATQLKANEAEKDLAKIDEAIAIGMLDDMLKASANRLGWVKVNRIFKRQMDFMRTRGINGY